MLQNIPTHLIAGPLGAGKTSVLRCLLAQRPAQERWAVLINEFGQVGLDAALLSRDEPGLQIAEVAGGCLCCVNGVPFQVGLGRLLRRIKPHRLFIEPSGLGHPLQLLEQLRQAPWRGVLAVQPMVMVLDAQALARDEPLPEVHAQALGEAGLLVINKSDAVGDSQRLLITAELPEIERLWTNHGEMVFHNLPFAESIHSAANSAFDAAVDNAPGRGTLWRDIHNPIVQTSAGEGGWSIGWRWHPSRQFSSERIRAMLERQPWKRAKGVIHSEAGWTSCNGLAPDPVNWQTSHWRNDTRLELIFDQPQDAECLTRAFTVCLLP
ncbi:CobW family GTP-binding protein [Pseudomonas sp. UBA6562]|uniref:CobW family GTP-binding protein n=1 Tax=Pseudomonas sp. UBA6562 TaxID=1947332 RepID=UPI0025CFF36F|nr:CobW-like GTP-binding protein [Pseudomonas sp. UBA6562]